MILNNSLSELYNHMKESIFNHIDIEIDGGKISIEKRQHYCDRGRFIVKVFPYDDGDKNLDVDDQDMFPRYYFRFENMIDEILLWTKAKKITIISLAKMGMDEWGNIVKI